MVDGPYITCAVDHRACVLVHRSWFMLNAPIERCSEDEWRGKLMSHKTCQGMRCGHLECSVIKTPNKYLNTMTQAIAQMAPSSCTRAASQLQCTKPCRRQQHMQHILCENYVSGCCGLGPWTVPACALTSSGPIEGKKCILKHTTRAYTQSGHRITAGPMKIWRWNQGLRACNLSTLVLSTLSSLLWD